MTIPAARNSLQILLLAFFTVMAVSCLSVPQREYGYRERSAPNKERPTEENNACLPTGNLEEPEEGIETPLVPHPYYESQTRRAVEDVVLICKSCLVQLGWEIEDNQPLRYGALIRAFSRGYTVRITILEGRGPYTTVEIRVLESEPSLVESNLLRKLLECIENQVGS